MKMLRVIYRWPFLVFALLMLLSYTSSRADKTPAPVKLNPEASKAWLEIEAAKNRLDEQYRILVSQQTAIAIGAGVPAADRLHPTQDKDGLIIFVHQEPQPQKETKP